MAQDRLMFKCARCGSRDFDIPDNPKPNDMVRCVGCGAMSRYADVQAQVTEAARKHIEDMARDIFKKRP